MAIKQEAPGGTKGGGMRRLMLLEELQFYLHYAMGTTGYITGNEMPFISGVKHRLELKRGLGRLP